MTKDEEIAEEYYYKAYPTTLSIGEEERKKKVMDIFLAGLKVGRQEKIHNLRKNPQDLPKENQEVLVYFTLPDKSKNDVMIAEFENNDFNYVDLQDVIAWCEIPNFKE